MNKEQRLQKVIEGMWFNIVFMNAKCEKNIGASNRNGDSPEEVPGSYMGNVFEDWMLWTIKLNFVYM